MHVAAIIPARGGSKGIPQKNIVEFCGKPLIAWSILQAKAARRIDSVWVSSDSPEILEVAECYGARPISRPDDISGDEASSESAWAHALDYIEALGIGLGPIVGMQATSPLREAKDIDCALELFEREKFDSLLSCCEIEDFFIWEYGRDEQPRGVNHDPANRQRRQKIAHRYLENGSFYIFRPEVLRRVKNRLGGQIGMYVMEKHKMFQIDSRADIIL